MWDVNVLTLFPEIFPGPLGLSITGNALDKGIWSLKAHQIRDYAKDKHKTVDDAAYGGGTGLLLKPDVLADALDHCFIPNANPIIYLSPRGQVFNQEIARELANNKGINLLCGRYEGVDERIFLEYNIREISIGDYVLSCGDIAALPLLDACIRLLDGVLDEGDALAEESFGSKDGYKHLLEYPHYTRPYEWRGHKVPDILLSGHHLNIEKWRLEQAKNKTRIVRPDLWDRCNKGE
jgi:tRNA (guanine37-N1)-methyltransferase